jgi:NADPH2:quinone reductase
MVVQDAPDPAAPTENQVLVRVRASGLNRGELNYAAIMTSGDAGINGVEFAGEVAAVGPGVKRWSKGDRVMGHGRNAQAQFVVAHELALMRIPDKLSFTDAAAFPNVYMTAHDAVVTNGELKAGESVLVNGASGGVAVAAIQVASLLGAKPVFATSRSASKLERLKAFGATELIDVTRDSQLDKVMGATDKKGVDIIIDTIGASVFDTNLRSLAVKGRLVNISRLGGSVAEFDLTQLWYKRLKIVGVTFQTRSPQERLDLIQACARDMLPLLEAGRVNLGVDRVFPMEQVNEAYAYMCLDQHVGKIVITID